MVMGEHGEGTPILDKKWVRLQEKVFAGYREKLESDKPRVRDAQLQTLAGERDRIRKALEDKLPKLNDLPPEQLAYRLGNIEALLQEFSPAVPEPTSEATSSAPETPEVNTLTDEKRAVYDQLNAMRRADFPGMDERGKRQALKSFKAEKRRLEQELRNPKARNGKSAEEIQYAIDSLFYLLTDLAPVSTEAKVAPEPEPEPELEEVPETEPEIEELPPEVEPEIEEVPKAEPEPELVEEEEPEDLPDDHIEPLEDEPEPELEKVPEAPEVEPVLDEEPLPASTLGLAVPPLPAPVPPKPTPRPRIIPPSDLPGGNAEPAPLGYGKKPAPETPAEPEADFEYGPGPETVESDFEYGPGPEDKVITPESYLSKFIRREFKGEVLPEDEVKAELTKTVVAKAIGYGLLSGAASRLGVKSIADVPRFLSQTYFTDKERSRLAEEFWESEHGLADDQMDLRVQKMTAAIESSKHLTTEQKENLIEQVTKIIETRNTEAGQSQEMRDRAIKDLFENAIQTRIKGTTVAKELINSALMGATLTGAGVVLHGARPIAFGSISAFERFKTVRQEMREGKREGSLAREYFVNGVWETYSNLKGGDAQTRFGKARNIAGAVGTLTRALSFGYVAAEYSPAFIDKALEVAMSGSHGAPEVPVEALPADVIPEAPAEMAPEVSAPPTPEVEVVLPAEVTPEPEAVPQELEPTEVVLPAEEAVAAPVAEGPIYDWKNQPDELGESKMPAEVVAPAAETVAAPAVAEVAREVVAEKGRDVKEMIERGTTHKNDTIVGLGIKQIEADPKALGYKGDLADKEAVHAFATKTAVAMARGQEIIKGEIDLRLNTGAIDHLSVVVKPDGYHFVNPETGAELSKAQMTEMTSYGRTIREMAAIAAPESPDVQQLERLVTLDDGEIKFTYDGGNVTGYDRMGFYENVSDTEIGVARGVMTHVDIKRDEADMIAQTIAADAKVLREMQSLGLENTPEYRYLVKDFTSGLRLVDQTYEQMDINEQHPLVKTFFEQAKAFEVPGTETIGGIEISRDSLGLGSEWHMGNRTAEFAYNADGSVSDVRFGDMYEKIKESEWRAVMETVKRSDVPQNYEESFAKTTAQYLFTLEQMEKAGLQDRPEYDFLKKDFEDYIESNYRDVRIDAHDDLYKDYLDDAKLKKVGDVSFGDSASTGVAEAASVAEAIPLETAAEVEAPIEVVTNPDHAGELLLKRPLIGDYGTVKFEYGPDGQVTGWDPELKYGIFAKNKAIQLLHDDRGKLDAGDLGFRPGFGYEPTGVYKAQAEIARQAFELVTTINALRDAGYPPSSPERHFLGEQLRNLIQETNKNWRGQISLTPQNPDVRKALQ